MLSARTAKGHVDYGALVRHERRQSLHLLQIDIGRKADAALAGQSVPAVLRAVRLDHLPVALGILARIASGENPLPLRSPAAAAAAAAVYAVRTLIGNVTLRTASVARSACKWPGLMAVCSCAARSKYCCAQIRKPGSCASASR